jgi:hypothetical protein
MRTVIIVIVILFGVLLLGGSISLGGQPLFGHLDSMIGASFFMDIHMAAFSFLYGGAQAVEDEFEETDSGLNEFSERPIGIDNKKKYKQLDEASQY